MQISRRQFLGGVVAAVATAAGASLTLGRRQSQSPVPLFLTQGRDGVWGFTAVAHLETGRFAADDHGVVGIGAVGHAAMRVHGTAGLLRGESWP